ncbi:glycosyltransferase family 2 protein [Nocardia sp. XZ_19_369]|uniref:glycosyltransferase family 2 protein n=1 Tax=Nocardia sp. XZ_19_369 TaxID=2769487 RepID=UPI00188E5F4C|nr:glycosyltransferase family 2 protein [Nocardia sp. XZ_19_369]
MTRSRTDLLADLAVTAAWIAGGWSTYSAHTTITTLTAMAARRRARPHVPPDSDTDPTIVVVVPMLHEADRGLACIAHWCKLLDQHPQLRLCVVTTEREHIEAPTAPHTWNTLGADPVLARLTAEGRAELRHYPEFNRTYGEQLGWALDHLARTEVDYFYIANADSRLQPVACSEIIEYATDEVDCAQQSAVFFGNLAELSWLATGEAFFQTRWTFEVELFRLLAGSRRIRWIPAPIADAWYQHAVGHGLLISRRYYQRLGGLPRPRYGLEDAALGVAIRTSGGHIEAFSTLECGDAPATARELQRQRSTWVRGPLCGPEYLTDRRGTRFAAQGLFDGMKWALGLPLRWIVLAALPPRHRLLAAGGLLLGLYGPLLRVLASLQTLEIASESHPNRDTILRGLTAYPFAATSYWLGGLRGLARLLHDITTRTPPIQQRTREST